MDDQIARALLQSLDTTNLWLEQISKQLTVQGEQQQSSYIQQSGQIQSMLDLFAALALPSSPELTREQTINAVTPTLLYRNDSLPFARIDVTNDDPAQWVYLGRRNVSVLIGRILMPQQNVPFVIPQGEDVWAICIVATVSLRISEAYDLLGMTQVIRQEQ
jgi:hypothetical protein